MTAPHDLDRQLTAFLAEGPTGLPDPSFDAVRDRIEGTRQRVVFGPWRVPEMNKLVALGIGIAAVAVAVFFGGQLVASPAPGAVGGAPSAQPTATPAPSPSPSPSASPAASPPPLTQSFTSQMHGISVSYPEGWTARAATEPWTDRPGVPQFLDPGFDVLKDPVVDGHLFLYFTSQPIGDSTPEDWVAGLTAECTTTEPIAVDGATGLVGCDEVAVTTAGRGYRIGLYANHSEAPSAPASYDRAWFEEVLATVQLRPQDALAAAPLTQTFTSQMHGISVSYPEGWIAQAANEPWTGCLYCTLVLEASYIDVLHRQPDDDGLFLRIASQPIGESAPEDWVATQMATDDRCTTTEPITVDGATGLGGGDSCQVAVVTTAGRGYSIDLYVSPDNPDLVAAYDRAWFEEILATVQLHPEDAVDVAPSASS